VKTLNLDIETFSSANLTKCGAYRYAEEPDFEVLLFGYSADCSCVHVIDLASGEEIPMDILVALTDDSVMKWAHNAAFERVCLSRYFGTWLSPESWRCTMVHAAYLGLPLSLEGAAMVTGAEKQKMTEGKELIRYFCKPCRPTKSNGGRTRNLPSDAPERWEAFKAYNARDVEAEMAIASKFAKFPVPESEWEAYVLDQKINDRGVALDMELVHKAIQCDMISRKKYTEAAIALTGLDNPNSTKQMKEWLAKHGLETDSLDKAAVAELLKTAPGKLGKALTLRQELSKSSVKKYAAMEAAVCKDGRAHGLIQFYGASRTGRFSGRLIQVQNLPVNHLPDIASARALVRCGEFDAAGMLYGSVSSVLSELIRTAFVPKGGRKFIVADFSAIEARVIAYLAGETWRNRVFATHGKIYEASASQMFRIPIEKITKGSTLRQKGKIAELALGYGGSVGALKAMGALEMGLSEDELRPLVDAWRSANPNIVKLWWDVDRAAKSAVKGRTAAVTHGIHFGYESGMLFITLPSGRRLSYVKPRMGINRFGGECVTYEGVGLAKKWERIESYGPKFTENIVQAISRDILVDAMKRLDASGYRIVMHCHDEVVIEAEPDEEVQNVIEIMCITSPWAKGLLLNADGYECAFYRKG
jgi:DNA polymerase